MYARQIELFRKAVGDWAEEAATSNGATPCGERLSMCMTALIVPCSGVVFVSVCNFHRYAIESRHASLSLVT